MEKFSWPEPQNQRAFPVAKAGYFFIFIAAFFSLVFAIAGLTLLTVLSACITLFICYFFRDPDRVIPDIDNAVISPADGKVIIAEIVDNNPFIDGATLKVSIFMSLFNVHVNRIPYSGIVKKIIYNPGKFFSANLDKASFENEHNAIVIKTQNGNEFCTVQIAGLVARRILCRVKQGSYVYRGTRFGMICFGSRLDLYLPVDAKLNVSVGDKVKAGTSILCFFDQ